MLYEKVNELERRLETLEKAVKNIVRIGEVKERRLEPIPQVRVEFEDHGGVVSWWCHIWAQKTHEEKCFWLPDLEELVVVLFNPFDLEQGYVVGALYNDPEDKRPEWGTFNTKIIEDRVGQIFFMDRAVQKMGAKTPLFVIMGDLAVTGNITDSLGDLTNHTNAGLPRDAGGACGSSMAEDIGYCGGGNTGEDGETQGTCVQACSPTKTISRCRGKESS